MKNRKEIKKQIVSIILLVIIIGSLLCVFYEKKKKDIIQDFAQTIDEKNENIIQENDKQEQVIEKQIIEDDINLNKFDNTVVSKEIKELQEDVGKKEKIDYKASKIKPEKKEEITTNIKVGLVSEKNNSEKTKTVKLNKENCEIKTNKEKTITIDTYVGNEDCIIIPNEIEGKQITEIAEEAFNKCYNLETIKVPIELEDAISKIKNFEIDKSSCDEEYIVLKTTREYSDAYIAYMSMPEEEREKSEIIPEKFNVELEEIYSEEMEKLYSVSTINEKEIEDKYDLRDYIDIEVENQGSQGTCYAYSALTSVETNIALTRGEIIDLSEIHVGVNTNGYGGNFNLVKEYYNSDLGPVYEEDWSKEEIEDCTSVENAELINKYLSGETISKEQLAVLQEEMNKTIQVEDKIETIDFPSISYEDKQDDSKREAIESTRLAIKEHIKSYGSIHASIYSGACNKINGYMVMNYTGFMVIDHGVSIVGWDDNFSKENFPESIRPKKDGAYLVLNSWGEDWGNQGYFWISYEDRWIESGLKGVISAKGLGDEISLGNINIKDLDNDKTLKNNSIIRGENIEIHLDVTTTSEILSNELKVNLRNNKDNFNSLIDINILDIQKNSCNITIPILTSKLGVDTYIIEIQYLEEVISKTFKIKSNIYDFIINEDGESIQISNYIGTDKNIEIPKEYLGFKVNGIADNAFYNNDKIESITVYENIENIGAEIIQNGIIIYGNIGAKIETYAKSNGYGFLEIGTKNLEGEYWQLSLIDKTLKINGDFEKNKIYKEYPWFRFNKSIYYVEINHDIKEIPSSAFAQYTNLKEIDTLSSVTSIGRLAFLECSNLTKIGNLSSVTTINDSAFFGCTSLDGLGSLSSVNTIGNWAFYGCSSLTSVGELSNVSEIGMAAFQNCELLTDIQLGRDLTIIKQQTFYNCKSLKNIDIPEEVSSIESHAFHGCYSLSNLNIPKNVTSIEGYVFYECISLTNINNLLDVQTIGDYAFAGCSKLKSMESLSNIETIGDCAFLGCMRLETIGSLSSVKKIGSYAFSDCSSLINIGNLPNLTIINKGTFLGCSSLINIGDLSSVTSIGDRAFCECSSLTKIESLLNTTSMGSNVFYKCSSLTKIENLSNITSIGSNTFYGCSSLKSIGDLPKIKKIRSGTFYGCSSLENIGDLSTVNNIGNEAFADCSSLESIGDLPNLTSFGAHVFRGCNRLESIGDLPNLTSLNSVFDGCSNLRSIGNLINLKIIHSRAFLDCSSLIEIGDLPNVISIEYEAFSGCGSLESIGDLPSLVTIAPFAFKDCVNIKTIGNLSNLENISSGAFLSCESLQKIGDLPNLKTLGINAFNGCSNLESIGDLSNVTSIGYKAFAFCNNLKNIGDLPNITTMGESVFEKCSNLEYVKIGKNIISIGKGAFIGCDKLTLYGYATTIVKGYAKGQSIKFIDLNKKNITIKVNPKVTYLKGEDLDLSKGIIAIAYQDGTTEELNMSYRNIEITGYDKTSIGEQIITVTYDGHSTQFKVNVLKPAVKIDFKNIPNKQIYKCGEELEATGGLIEVMMEDGEIVQLPMTHKEVSITGYNNRRIGEQKITVSYRGASANYAIIVEDYVKSIGIQKKPTKILYQYGEKLDLTGGILQADFASGIKQMVPLKYCKIDGYNSEKEGNQELTVIYVDEKGNKYTTKFNVKVEKPLVNISTCSIQGITDKEYTGKTLTQNIIVKYGNTQLVNGTDYTISYLNNIDLGRATIKIIGKGKYKGEVTKTFIIKPKKITGVKVKEQTPSAITISWTKHGGNISGYRLYSYNYSKEEWEYVGKTSSTSYRVKNLNAGTIYKYRVRSYKTIDGNNQYGSYSSSVKTTTKPNKVSGLKVKTQETDSITINWSKNKEKVTGYKIYSYNYSKEKWEYVGKTSSTSYKIKRLKAGTTYKFRVRAYKTVDGEQYFGDYTSSIKTTTKTKTPKISKITTKSKKATIKWGKITGATGYEIYMSTSTKGKYSKIKTITKGSVINYTKDKLKKNKKYYFKIRTYRTVDGKKIYSSYSSVKSIKVK